MKEKDIDIQVREFCETIGDEEDKVVVYIRTDDDEHTFSAAIVGDVTQMAHAIFLMMKDEKKFADSVKEALGMYIHDGIKSRIQEQKQAKEN